MSSRLTAVWNPRGPENLPVAHKVADSVICLPMYSGLEREEVERVLDCIVK